MNFKICSKCKIEKPTIEFHKDSNGKLGVRASCKTCDLERHRIYRRNNPTRYVDYVIEQNLRRFNLTLEEYNEMLLEQNFKCAICKKEQNLCSRRFAVDHCHTTGKVRSLLCSNCNTALGLLKEDVVIVSSLLEYIKSFEVLPG